MEYAYIGSWCADITTGASAANENGGLKAYRVDEGGKFELLNQAAPQINVGIIAKSADGKFLYTNDERKDYGGVVGNGGGIAAFKVDPASGEVTFINEVPSGGAFPNYVVTDSRGRYVFAGHHGHHDDVITRHVRTERSTIVGQRFFDESSVAMYPIREDGSVGECCDLKVLTGSSINYREQWTAHSHSVRLDPSEKYLLTCDKGSDVIRVYEIDYENGLLSEVFCHETEKGMQPRHMYFHPALPILYVCAEAGGFVCAYLFDTDTGALHNLDRELTVPADFEGDVGPADIKVHHSGKYLYVSNRGHDTIACIRLDEVGRMTLIDCVPCGGSNPRGMEFDVTGDVLYVTNMTGSVVAFRIDEESGKLTHTGYQLSVKTPLCIQFLKANQS